ncbi:MAG: hypothetical protein WC374_01135 [Phycisphaerae bacterium]|jgi:hypothetical protein
MDKLNPKTDSVLRQLIALKRKELIAMASEFSPPVELKQSWNARQIAFAIRKRQLADQAAAGNEPIPPRTDNPEFEQAVSDIPLTADSPAETRGGARPGAGRPAGSTTEHVRIKRVMEISQPNETIKGAYEMAFGLMIIRCEQLAPILTKERAYELSIPMTKICEFYYKDAIPEETLMWMELAISHGVVAVEVLNFISDVRTGKIKKEVNNGQSTESDNNRQNGQRQDEQGS